MVAPDGVLSMGQIEQASYANEWLVLNYNCYIEILETIFMCTKKRLDSFKYIHLQIVFTNHTYFYVYI